MLSEIRNIRLSSSQHVFTLEVLKSETSMTSIVSLSLECRECLKEPEETPIYQCNKGHLICKPCYEGLDLCPSCGIKVIKISDEENEPGPIRSTIAETIISEKLGNTIN